MRQAFQSHPRYHRLNVQFDGDEPRLDDVHSIPALKLRAEEDGSLSLKIDNVARCFIASLFYFELDAIPQRSGGKHSGTGHILCSIRHNDKAFPVLFNRLAINSAQFWIDGYPIMKVVENGCFDDDGNFRKRVELNTDGRFAIALKQDASEPCNISGSPFSVEKMILLQGFSAVFGRPDHRKRKNSGYLNTSKRKNRRTA